MISFPRVHVITLRVPPEFGFPYQRIPNPPMLPAQNYELESFRFQNHNFGGFQQTPTLDHPMGLLRGEGERERRIKGKHQCPGFTGISRSFYSPKFGEGAASLIETILNGSKRVHDTNPPL